MRVAGTFRVNAYSAVKRAMLAGAGDRTIAASSGAGELECGEVVRSCTGHDRVATPFWWEPPYRRRLPLGRCGFAERLLPWFDPPDHRALFA